MYLVRQSGKFFAFTFLHSNLPEFFSAVKIKITIHQNFKYNLSLLLCYATSKNYLKTIPTGIAINFCQDNVYFFPSISTIFYKQIISKLRD